jgi:DNA topoisomerase-1
VLGLDPKTTKRIVFHEITKSAIEEAIKNPRTVDMKLVEAQQARQILDRIVGFELSPVVWQKVPGGKSAGRVQSPAVRLLVEREREITAFEGSSQFKVTAIFVHNGEEVKAELKQRFDYRSSSARHFSQSLEELYLYAVTDVTKSPSTRNPAAPFTTSTLQQEANSKLGFSSKATMSAAQKLYQEGRITYMRTDSVNLSSGQAIAAATDFIKRLYGIEYSHVRKFKTKSANAQEAHEAIRPTDMSSEVSQWQSEYDQKLYDSDPPPYLSEPNGTSQARKHDHYTILVRATDLAPSGSSDKTRRLSKPLLYLRPKGQIIVFDGFLRVYGGGKEDAILPAVTSGDALMPHSIEARQVFATATGPLYGRGAGQKA